MAKNWTAAEAAKVIIEGKDLEAIADIAHRFPTISVLLAKCNDAAIAVMSAIPEFITIRKMESAIKSINSGETEDEIEVEIAAPKDKRAAKKPAKKAPKKVEKKKKPVVIDDDDDDDFDDFDLDDDDED